MTTKTTTTTTFYPADRRGHSKHSWLDSHHSFSFANFHDPERMGIGPLRVLNDDWVQAGQGFGAHPHRDMEIVSYVLSGALEHRDSAGHGGIIKAGEAQFMRAGSGVTHSEQNASKTEPVHFLQIWIHPRTKGQRPAYDQRPVDLSKSGEFVTIASSHGEGIQIDQDASIRTARLEKGQTVALPKHPGRAYYAFVIDGVVETKGREMRKGDAMLILEDTYDVKARAPSQVLLFNVPLPAPSEFR
jgi:redox-sensitive bicupin YhaK (pirin superfamily)